MRSRKHARKAKPEIKQSFTWWLYDLATATTKVAAVLVFVPIVLALAFSHAKSQAHPKPLYQSQSFRL